MGKRIHGRFSAFPIPPSRENKLVVESRGRCGIALELLIFFYGNGLVNQKELSSQIIPLLLWGGKTATESKRSDQLQQSSMPWHHHERQDKDWMSRFVWESWDSAPTLGALGSHSQAKCDPSPGLSTGTGAFPAPCPPQDLSWLCGKREGIGREQRVP